MRILFIASGNHGNVSPVVKNQGDSLVALGHEVEYYLIVGKGIKGYLKHVIPLHNYLRNHHYDAVHAHYSLTAFVASLAGTRPLVVSLLGSDVKASNAFKWIIRTFDFLFGWQSIIVKSQDMLQSLGITKAQIMPNGVNTDRFQPMKKKECQMKLGWKSEAKHVLFPANPDRPEKDYALANAALDKLRDKLKINGVSIEMHYFVNVPNEETPYHYNAADVVLMTSKWEGSPNAIKEALACNRPIVATDMGDVRERFGIPSLDGCYVAKSREPKELAGLIELALSYDSTTGREKIFADGLTTELVAEKLLDIYKGAILGC